MDSALFLLLGLTSFVCFALRALPRIGKPLLGHDAWVILLAVDQLKKGRGYNGVSEYFLLGGEHDYPPLFFYFLSLFPSSWLRRYNWIINPILDSLNAAVLVLVSYFLTGQLLVAASAGIIYSFTPVVMEESFILSTRIFGLIAFNVTLLSLLFYESLGKPAFLLCVIVGGIIVLLSHKFATEVLCLLLFFIAVFDWSYLPMLALFAVFAGAVLLSGGFYLKVARGHLGILRFWLKHYREYGAGYVNRGEEIKREKSEHATEPRDLSGQLIRRLWRRTKRANPLYWLLNVNPFNPFSLVVILIPLLGVGRAWEWTLIQWSIMTLAFYYAATHLRFLGHYPGRSQFMDYNAFPTALLCAIFVWGSFAYWKLIVMSVVFALSLIQNVRSWTRIHVYSRSDDQSVLEDVFQYLRRSSKDGVICLPASHTYAVPYFSGKKVFYTMSARSYEKLAAFFPVLTVPIGILSEEYGISFVIVDETIVPVEALDLTGFKLVMERNGYLLFEKST
jgi:hypothetical protein